MSSLLKFERQQNDFLKSIIRIRILLFLAFSFRIKTTNTFINSRSSLKTHTRFQTKMGKIYTRFQTAMAQKTLPLGRLI